MDIKIHCKYDTLQDPKTLKPNPKNPNTHPRKQLDALIYFIRASGWRHPIVVSARSGFVVSGHARRQAAVELCCLAPVVTQDFDSEAMELAFLLADNKLAELAEMDALLLDSGLDFLNAEGFDTTLFGFDFDLGFAGQADSNTPDSPVRSLKGSYDEIKVFILPSLRRDFLAFLKSFQNDRGEDVLRWQKK